MQYEELNEVFFGPKTTSELFYSAEADSCPNLSFLYDEQLHNFSNDDIDVEMATIFCAGKHAVLVVGHDFALPDDLSPNEVLAFLEKHHDTVDGLEFWLFMLMPEKLKRMLNNLTAHFKDRKTLQYINESAKVSTLFIECKKGERFYSVHYTATPLPSMFLTA